MNSTGTYAGTVSGTLTFTNGIINTGANTFTLGVATATLGTLTYTAGGFGSGSSFARWYPASGAGTTLAAGAIPSFGAGSYPFVSGNPVSGMLARHFHRNTSTFSTGGPFKVTYNNNSNGTTSLTTPFTETVNYDKQTNASWTTSVVSPGVLSGTSAQFCIQGEGAFANTTGNVVLVRNGVQFGTALTGSTHPMGQRAGLSVTDQAGTYTLAYASSQDPKQSITSGKWEDASTWSGGLAPTCGDVVFIMPGHTVSVDANTGIANASSTFVSKTSTLNVSGGTLNIGCTVGKNNDSLVNNGTLIVSSGIVNINGSLDINNGSNFTHSGGNINIDGNDGATTVNSVRNDKPLFGIGTYTALASGTLSFTGGTIYIIDPHRSATAPNGTTNRSYAFYSNLATSSNSVDASTLHTIQFGDGVSTHSGGSSTGGFVINTYPGSGRFNFGNLVVNDISNPTASNRIVRANSYAPNCRGNFTITKGRYEMASLGHVFGGNVTINDTLIANGPITFANPVGTTSIIDSVPQTISGTGKIFNNSTLASATANFSGITINNRQGFGGVTFANNFNQIGAQPANTISSSGSLIFTLGTATTPTGVAFVNGVPGTTASNLTRTAGGWTNGSTYGIAWTTANTGTGFTAGTLVSTTTSQLPFVTSTGLDRSAWINRVTPTAGGVTAITYNESAGSTTGLSIVDASGYTITQRSNDNWIVSTLGTTPSSATFGLAISANSVFGGPLSADSTRILQLAGVVGTHQRGTIDPQGQRTGLTLAQLTTGAFYIGANGNEVPNTTIANGDWSQNSTWSKGVPPTCFENVVISHNVTITTAGLSCKNATINAGGILSHNSGGALTVGCTDNNAVFLNNGGTFNMNAGTLTVNGKFAVNGVSTGVFNQTGGDIIVDGNSGVAATSCPGHIVDMYCHGPSGLNLTGGTFTVTDPVKTATAGSYAFKIYPSPTGINCGSGTGWTLNFGNGGIANAGGNSEAFRIATAQSSTVYKLNNPVNINLRRDSANTWVNPDANTNFKGDVTITKGELRNAATSIYFGGNIINNDTFTNTGTITLSDYNISAAAVSSTAQTISGTGVFRNSATPASVTANTTSITINNNNATGVTFNVPLSISGTLTMTSGIVNTSTTNLLRLGTASAVGTLSCTPSATNFINGPFARTQVSRTSSGTFTTATLFPVGKVGSTVPHLPIYVDPTLTGNTIITAEAFTGNAGTGGSGVSNLSTNYWSVTANTPSNITGSRIQVNHSGIGTSSKLLYSASASGTYDGTPGGSNTAIGTSVTSTMDIVPFLNYYSFGDLAPCSPPADQAIGLTASNLTTTTFTGTINIAPSNPTGYLVVRYASGGTPTAPTNNTSYTVGGTLGTGTVRGIVYSLAPFQFSESGLTASTSYDYYVYAFNNSGCAGPVYNTVSPTTYTHTTCGGTVSAPTHSSTTIAFANLTSSGFDLNWTIPTTAPTPPNTLPNDYLVDISTNSTFTSIVPGYENLSMGPNPPYTISGLNPATNYFVRIKGSDNGCVSSILSYGQIPTLSSTPVSSFSFNFDNGTTWPSGVARYRPNGVVTDYVTIGTTGFSSSPNSVALYGVNTYTTQGILIMPLVNNANAGTHRIKFNYQVPNIANATCDFGYLTNPQDPATFTSIQLFTATAANTNKVETVNIPTTVPQNVHFAFRNSGPTATAGTVYLDDIIYEPAPVCTSPSLATAAITSANATIFCNSGSSIISTTGYNKDSLGFTYQWQSSTDNFGSNIVDIGTANSIYSNYSTPLLANSISYRLKTTCANVGSAFSTPVSITVNVPTVLTSVGDTVCGSSVASLSASTNAGQTLRWYNSASGGSILGTGNTFTTPVLSATTNYFVESAISQSITGGARTSTTSTSATTASNYGLVFDAYQDMVIDSVTVYPTSTAGNLVVSLTNSSGTVIGSNITIPIPAGNASTPPATRIPIGISVPAGTGYRLIAVSSPSLVRESALGGFPYSIGGSGSVTSGFITNPGSTTYYYFYNWKVTSTCSSSPRTSVTATYVTPPALTIDSNSFALCSGNTSTPVNVTSTLADFDTYTWSPALGVSGGSTATFNPTATTAYTLTAANSTTGCANTLNRTVTVNQVPNALIFVPATPAMNCGDAPIYISTTGGIVTKTDSIGTGSTLTGATSQPTAFCNRYKNYWSQMVFTAAELTAMGMVSGSQINSLGFRITSLGDGPNVSNFTIDMGHTTNSTLSAMTTSGLTRVKNASTYVHQIGLNTINFNTPFTWNGTDNILIDLRQTGADLINNAITYYTATAGNTVLFATTSTTYTSPDDYVATNPSFATSTSRLNTQFQFTLPVSRTWANTTGLFTDAAGTTAYTGTPANSVYFKYQNNMRYVATTTSNNGCRRTDTVIVTSNAPSTYSGITGATLTDSGYIANGNVIEFHDNACKVVAKLVSNGASPVKGIVDVTHSNSGVAVYSTHPYIGKIFNIEPVSNASTATGRITLYYTDQDMIDYNTYLTTNNLVGAFPFAPTLADSSTKSLFRVTQYHGPNATPNSNTGSVAINPTIVYNTALAAWQVEFDVNGFSSFYAHTNSLSIPLDLEIVYFDAYNKGDENQLIWKLNETEEGQFEVMHSTDGRTFNALSKIELNSAIDYSYVHTTPADLEYYKIKYTSKSGKLNYSTVKTVKKGSSSWIANLYPNPLKGNYVNLDLRNISSNVNYQIFDLTGRLVQNGAIEFQKSNMKSSLFIGNLNAGIYSVIVNHQGDTKTIRLIINN